MKEKITTLQRRLYVVAGLILLAGFTSAVWIYLRAEENWSAISGYEVAGGQMYPVVPEDSKMYMHNLELYGGKINVLANELMRWFVGLWHGKTLAYTVAFISIVLSFGVFLSANHLGQETKSDGKEENSRRQDDI